MAWDSDDPDQTEVSGVTVQHGQISTLGLPAARALGDLARIVLAAVRQTIDIENAKAIALAKLLPCEVLRKKEMPKPFAPSWALRRLVTGLWWADARSCSILGISHAVSAWVLWRKHGDVRCVTTG